jgi:hypothetical protein
MANSPEFYLFGTSGCHLCEQAEALIQQAVSPERWRSCDIADDTHLLHAYGRRIPVLRHERSGAELDWPFGVDDLDRFLTRAVGPTRPKYFQPSVTS